MTAAAAPISDAEMLALIRFEAARFKTGTAELKSGQFDIFGKNKDLAGQYEDAFTLKMKNPKPPNQTGGGGTYNPPPPPNPGPKTPNTQSDSKGGTLDGSRRARPAAWVYLRGRAARAGFEIPAPRLVNIGKVEVIPSNRADKANADMQRVYDDIDEARAMSDSLSRLTEAQTDINHDLREIMLPIKQGLAEILAGMTEFFGLILNLVKDDIISGIEGVKLGVEATKEIVKAIPILSKVAEDIEKEINEKRRESAEMRRKESMELLEKFLGVAEPLVAGVPPPDPNKARFDQRIGLPLFG